MRKCFTSRGDPELAADRDVTKKLHDYNNIYIP